MQEGNTSHLQKKLNPTAFLRSFQSLPSLLDILWDHKVMRNQFIINACVWQYEKEVLMYITLILNSTFDSTCIAIFHLLFKVTSKIAIKEKMENDDM